ncbi:urease accessory protein UreD [Roseibium aestuarii]|uniref:Urease accessory protein UreD n=1 Tax=Roseibium aestuarii TaxID=2600299 RepID=A0ABW4JZD1_9HYPH|nr:urease accessory protein UreD [Roseibium aestuarii]
MLHPQVPLTLAEPTAPDTVRDVTLQRARGEARVTFKLARGRSCLDDLYQAGATKVRLPKIHEPRPVAVFINTAGGITGGDRLSYSAGTGEGAEATLTTQAAERAYRRSTGVGRVETRLTAAAGSTLEWLPQETILFDRSALARRLHVDLTGDARFLALESTVLGRTAMGESVDEVLFRDSWRIRRDGRLIFADEIRLEGNSREILKGAATGDGALAFASLVDCRPDAEDHLARARSALEAAARPGLRAAASAWNGVLAVRLVGRDGRCLRDGLMAFLEAYRARALPRVWRL